MNLQDLSRRKRPPVPWEEGDNIPWNDPAFSRRMLAEHLSQVHDAASRRTEIIEKQVGWIHAEILGGEPSKILDLACGPGLYLQRFACLGHRCEGIDFSPASVAHGREEAGKAGLAVALRLEDVREADFGSAFDLVMMLSGQVNVFQEERAKSILRRAHEALAPGGSLLLEGHRFDAVKAKGDAPQGWDAVPGGLFSDRPHLLLVENFWDRESETATERFVVLEEGEAEVRAYALSTKGYGNERYATLLAESGFTAVEVLDPVPFFDDSGYFLLVRGSKGDS